MEKIVNKTVRMRLVGLNGNAFALMGAFAARAREQDWTSEEINKVLDDAMSGDYEHLIRVLATHTTETNVDEGSDE